MATNISPIFVLKPRVATNLVSTANTNRNGTTGTYVTVFSGAAGRSKVFTITIQAIGTTTAGVVRLFVNDGTTTGMIWEQLILAVTPSTSIACERYDLHFDGVNLPELFLQSGATITASTNNAESFMITVIGGDYE